MARFSPRWGGTGVLFRFFSDGLPFFKRLGACLGAAKMFCRYLTLPTGFCRTSVRVGLFLRHPPYITHVCTLQQVFGGMGGAAGALDDLIVVANKADLATGAKGEGGGLGDAELNALAAEAAAGAAPRATPETAAAGGGRGLEGGRVWKLSCKTKDGLEGFMEHLEAEVRSRFQGTTDDESPLITRCVCVCAAFDSTAKWRWWFGGQDRKRVQQSCRAGQRRFRAEGWPRFASRACVLAHGWQYETRTSTNVCDAFFTLF